MPSFNYLARALAIIVCCLNPHFLCIHMTSNPIYMIGFVLIQGWSLALSCKGSQAHVRKRCLLSFVHTASFHKSCAIASCWTWCSFILNAYVLYGRVRELNHLGVIWLRGSSADVAKLSSPDTPHKYVWIIVWPESSIVHEQAMEWS